MKKFIALAIAVVMLAALAVPAFAANETSGTTEVTYTVGSTYTVDIPATVAVGETVTVKLSAVNILEDQKVTVTASTDGKFNGTIEGAFEIAQTGTELVDTDDTVTVAVTAGDGLPTAAGIYTGSITYVIALE